MRFDDRLRTVLAQPAADPHDRAVRWRQLVEIVARSGAEADPQLVEQAVAEIRAGSDGVDERVRTAAALAVAPLPLPVALVACFAAEPIAVAAPVLAAAKLSATEWSRVTAMASEESKAFIAMMRSGPGAPPSPARRGASGGDGASAPEPTISDVVARIERLRQLRESESSAQAPEVSGEESPRLFKWECNEAGEIDWVEGAPRGALVGQSIAQRGPGGGVDPSVERAFAARTPFHQGLLDLPAGSKVGGSWKISGVPAFERSTGRFAGYRGVAERPEGASPDGTGGAIDTHSLRELAHEIKTPLNAIIGFAEIISGEYLGPAGDSFRQRADDIVDQARLLLNAVEDLDFAARLRSRDRSAETDLADALAQSWEEIERAAARHGVRVDVSAGEKPLLCALDPQLAARLVERLCVAVIAAATEGETLTFRIAPAKECCALRVNCPASLHKLDLSPDRNRRAADIATLPLRLVMSLARTAGGELLAEGGELLLRLPKA